jgi:hypothetical protein
MTSPRSAITVGIFIGLIGVLLAAAIIALSTIGERRSAVLVAENTLTQLERRSPLSDKQGRPALGDAPAGPRSSKDRR